MDPQTHPVFGNSMFPFKCVNPYSFPFVGTSLSEIPLNWFVRHPRVKNCVLLNIEVCIHTLKSCIKTHHSSILNYRILLSELKLISDMVPAFMKILLYTIWVLQSNFLISNMEWWWYRSRQRELIAPVQIHPGCEFNRTFFYK